MAVSWCRAFLVRTDVAVSSGACDGSFSFVDSSVECEEQVPMLSTPEQIVRASAVELAAAMRAGEVTSEQVTRAFLDRIDAVDGVVHAFLHRNDQEALAVAREVDAARAAGEELPPLAGVPIAVKDIAATVGQPTTAASRFLQGWMPPYDATVVERIRQARMPILGKTNMDEFAMGGSTEHSAYGVTRNPWSLDRVPGGSGGGSAAVLAAHMAPLAVGSDTGGSIRQPAAFTGTVGVKPTYGGVSRYGVISLASSLDQIGPCANTVEDAALLHEVLGGHDPRDSTSLPDPVPPVVEAARSGDLQGLRVGAIPELISGEAAQSFGEGVLEQYAAAIADLEAAGAQIVEIEMPHFRYGVAAYYLILPSEASSNLARYDAMRYGRRVAPAGVASPDAEQVMAASREAGFGPEVKRRIILGTYALSSGYYDAYYGQAQKVRTLIAGDFSAAFASVDVIASPTATVTPYVLGEKIDDPVALYVLDALTIPANLAGLPAMSVPVGTSSADGLPVGMQFIAPARADDRLYRVGAGLERAVRERLGAPVLASMPDLIAAVAAFEGEAADITGGDR
ncbi:Glutamyl-tRNA(Gln) amidotransferase subunit A [Dermatophilus congolensis]|uniref:Glutamyl-tRNA(Gln) amidotransferase subunit A n=2 Tax=Dermatophilus congolensis TaxID=1863 RepID=A0A239VFE7_9MICO|nr:Glutamyl-tRNA(Gln) amidotransferase subunit A [Dermatophilus congolensis]